MKQIALLCGFAFLFLIASCEKKDTSSLPFVKIYDDQNGNRSFTPLSIIKSTQDHGYIVLSAFDGWKIQLMKIDKDGVFKWNLELPDTYVNAVPSLVNIDEQLYLVCMDPIELNTRILRIDETNHSVVQVSTLEEVSYPVHAYHNGDHLYLMSCPLSSQMMGIHEVSTALDTVIRVGALTIGMNVDEQLLKHAMHTGKQWPFFIKSTPEKDRFVVNGFYNYSFSTVFLDNNLLFTGVYNGAALDGGMNQLEPLGAGEYALSRISGEYVFFNPKLSLNPSAVEMATSLEAQGDSELNHETPVLIKELTIKGAKYRAFLASTRSNQLSLKLYDETGKKVAGTYISKNIPIKACDLIQTPYGELLILTQVRVMGSYNRIGTIKLSKVNLEDLVTVE
jgi:hypothetical protein